MSVDYSAGQCFYSRAIGRNVMSIDGEVFFVVGWNHKHAYIQELGELVPLVRDTHYSAAIAANQRFIQALRKAKRDTNYETEDYWQKAVDSIAQQAQLANHT